MRKDETENQSRSRLGIRLRFICIKFHDFSWEFSYFSYICKIVFMQQERKKPYLLNLRLVQGLMD